MLLHVVAARARRDAALADCTNQAGSGNAFLKEILYSSADASQLLDDTQKALQVAQDLFGEDSKVRWPFSVVYKNRKIIHYLKR